MRAAALAAVFLAAVVATAEPPKASADALAKSLDQVADLTDEQRSAVTRQFADALSAAKKANTPAELKKVAGKGWADLADTLTPAQHKKVDAFLTQWGKARAEKVRKYQAAVMKDKREDARDRQQKPDPKKNPQAAARDRLEDKKDREDDKKRDADFRKREPRDDLFDLLTQFKANAGPPAKKSAE